ncbi:hypothetical protein [Piscinibacter koreensis]|uniref:Tetratricopeptide repeat protein n=1 Tax=Piscinibacter koreensis TaxID=2742824 RepID=A0A7Y6TYH2_9BURK|nr:hypothetical protein [Schlegelella koreensis]NUZ08102.1 hypothetical protein [Schlegelella koreensis]
MEALDLKRHRPDHFSGKTLTLGGADYVVGELFRAGEQGYMHPLRNVRSGLALHLVQIRQSYRHEPDAAAAASRLKARGTTALRTGFFRNGQPCPVAPMRALDLAGGVLELHEHAFGLADADARLLDGAADVAEAGQIDAALERVEGFLARHPDHTAALALAAELHGRARQRGEALARIEHAVAIEPNLSTYALRRATCMLDAGRALAAASVLADFRHAFPGEPDAAILAVHTALRRGQPEEARRALDEVAAPTPVIAELASLIDRAARASALVAGLAAQRRPGLGLTDDALATLQRAHELYALDPAVDVNLAFALRDRGDFARATELLTMVAGAVDPQWVPYVRMSAAFCFAARQDWARAEANASNALQMLGHPAEILPADVPGLVTWIDFDRGTATEHPPARALAALDAWSRGAAEAGTPSQATEVLRPLYEKAAATFGGAAHAAAAPPEPPPWWKRLLSSRP